MLELIHRLPANDHLKGHVKPLLSTMFFLLEIENEENVLVCLRVIIDLHKQFRPSFSTEVSKDMYMWMYLYSVCFSVLLGGGKRLVQIPRGQPCNIRRKGSCWDVVISLLALLG